MLQEPAHRACAVNRVVAFFDHILSGLRRQSDRKLLLLQTLLQILYHQINDRRDLCLTQRLVEYDLVQTVQKFRTKLALQQGIDLIARFLRNGTVGRNPVQNIIRTKVGGQDDDRILEVDLPAL